MTPDILYSKLNELIHSNYYHSTPKSLIEDGKDAKCKEVNLKYNGKISAYKFDPQGDVKGLLFPFYNSSGANAHAMCDYIVFCPQDDFFFVFLCNLKSNNIANSHDQIQAAYLFAKFLLDTAARCINGTHYPHYVKFLAIHFTTGKLMRSTVNVKSFEFGKYKNGLLYITKPCKEECALDNLSEYLKRQA